MSEQQRLINVHFHNIKNLRDFKITFDGKPVMGIFGPNGCGKSTILHVLACLYHPKSGKKEDIHKFSDFFKSDEFTNWIGSSVSFKYYYRNGREDKAPEKTYTKRGTRWIREYKKRPDRDIFFIGLRTCVPDIEIESKNKATVNTRRDPKAIAYSDKVMRDASMIMGRKYVDYFNSANGSKKYITVENDYATKYKSLSMGAGEQRIFKILQTFYDAPKYSLILIDEIDLTLHTSALTCLMNRIVSIAKEKNLQVVFTSHREELMNRNDIEVRHIFQTPQKTLCLSNTTPACVDRMTGVAKRPLDIFVEDNVSKHIIQKILLQKGVNKRVNIETFGAISNAFTVASGLFMIGKLTENIAVVTDGDNHRDHESKITQLKKFFTGTEQEAVDNREKVARHILQYTVEADHIAPELYIWKTLTESERENEIVEAAKSIQYVDDSHKYLTDIIDILNVEYSVGLVQVINEFSEHTDQWNLYVSEISEWLDNRIESLHLYNMKTFSSSVLDLIGGGGNSKVFRPNPAKTDCPGVVIKVPQYNKHLTDYLKARHERLVQMGLPTLSTLDICIVDGNEAIICEDISSENLVFVSPHSTETDESKTQREALELLGFGVGEHVDNLCEQTLYNTKVDTIRNLQDFLTSVKNDLTKLSENKVYVEHDSYFFGVDKTQRDVDLCYKLADLDNIYEDINDRDDLYKVNVDQFKDSIINFIQKFVITENQQSYIEEINSFVW